MKYYQKYLNLFMRLLIVVLTEESSLELVLRAQFAPTFVSNSNLYWLMVFPKNGSAAFAVLAVLVVLAVSVVLAVLAVFVLMARGGLQAKFCMRGCSGQIPKVLAKFCMRGCSI